MNLAVGYGGRREIADAVRSLLAEHAERGTSLEELVEALEVEHIAEHLYTRGQPDPDLVIRTSGEQRMSGFLLWQTANSEFHFTDVYWPDFRRVDFLRALRGVRAGTAASAADPARAAGRATTGTGPSPTLSGPRSAGATRGGPRPSSTCGSACASTGSSRRASSTRTPATRGCARQVADEPAPTRRRSATRPGPARSWTPPACRPTGPTSCAAS